MRPDLDPSLVNIQGDTARMVAERMGSLAHMFDAVTPGVATHCES